MSNLRTELLRMKERCGLTNEEISKDSHVPLQTVNNVFSGRTQDPGYSTVAALVKAMHGSMDDIEGFLPHHHENSKEHCDCEKCEKRIEKNKDLYERMIASRDETITAQKADIKDREKSLKDLKEAHDKLIDSKNKLITVLAVLLGILGAILLGLVGLDFLLPTIGWITYQIWCFLLFKVDKIHYPKLKMKEFLRFFIIS